MKQNDLRYLGTNDLGYGSCIEMNMYKEIACIDTHYHNGEITCYAVQQPWELDNDEVYFDTQQEAMDYIDEQVALGYHW